MGEKLQQRSDIKKKKKDYFVSKLNMILAVYSIISTIKKRKNVLGYYE